MHVDDTLAERAEVRYAERLRPQVLVRLSVNRPVDSASAKPFCRHTSQDVCPWNVKFATELREPAFAPREIVAERASRVGTRALAREILRMEPENYAAVFKGSAIKRAKLWMLKRNAAVVLGNIGPDEDVAVLRAMVLHEHEVVREHATWALGRIGSSAATDARVSRSVIEEDPPVIDELRSALAAPEGGPPR